MIQFTWRVAVDGYEWVRLDEKRDLVKIGPDDGPFDTVDTADENAYYLVPVGWRFAEYEPLLEYSGLFRAFAQTEPTFHGILPFANKYGNLGSPFNVMEIEEEPEPPPGEVESKEERKEWKRENLKHLRRSDEYGLSWRNSIT